MPVGDEGGNHSTRTAMQLTLHTRTPGSGRLETDGFIGSTLRASLLIDLALEGRIERGTQLTIDCEPTGVAPADLLLSAIESRPDRNLGWWIGQGPRVRQALADEWVRAGRWQRVGLHYIDVVDPAGHEWQARRDRLDQVIAGTLPASVQEAVLTAMAGIAQLVWPPDLSKGVPPKLLAECGSVRWLIELTDEFMIYARIPRVGGSGGAG